MRVTGPAQCNVCLEKDETSCSENQQTQVCGIDPYSLGTTHCGSAVGRYRQSNGDMVYGFYRGCINCAGRIKKRNDYSLRFSKSSCAISNFGLPTPLIAAEDGPKSAILVPFYSTNTSGFQKSMNKVLGADQCKWLMPTLGWRISPHSSTDVCKPLPTLMKGWHQQFFRKLAPMNDFFNDIQSLNLRVFQKFQEILDCPFELLRMGAEYGGGGDVLDSSSVLGSFGASGLDEFWKSPWSSFLQQMNQMLGSYGRT
ncbi:putative skeletal organic matrix protein 2 [Acropora cervicornis]|uniref:Skeletal organic matrix protein 2 n=1 Tax=Acropora cervicornis TaxID=6130 RepID=A0AAD9QJR5_ACRCE|nr:putative skeletal organic matrix protein 2 [Acropora cervicornis]